MLTFNLKTTFFTVKTSNEVYCCRIYFVNYIQNVHIIKRTLHGSSKIWILCSSGKNIKSISSPNRVISSIYQSSNWCCIHYQLKSLQYAVQISPSSLCQFKFNTDIEISQNDKIKPCFADHVIYIYVFILYVGASVAVRVRFSVRTLSLLLEPSALVM